MLTWIVMAALIAIGVGMFAPLPTVYKQLTIVVATVMLAGSMYKLGANSVGVVEAKREVAVVTAVAEHKDETIKVNETVRVEYVDRIKYVDRFQTKVVKEFVTKEADSKCVINTGFVRLYNAAAVADYNIKPETTDDQPTDVQLSDVAEADKENLMKLNKANAQIESLQGWITSQSKAWADMKKDVESK